MVIAELLDSLRSYERGKTDTGNAIGVALADAAKMIEDALPKWTRITDDESTWPADDESVLTAFNEEITSAWGEDCDVGWWWRPLCDLDTPPEPES